MKNYSPSLLLSALVLICFDAMAQQVPQADYLIVPDPHWDIGANAEYTKLYRHKLFLTPGNLARFIQLPGPLAKPEVVVSVYQKGNADEYQITLTEPSRRLADCDPIDPALPKMNPNTIRISRYDALLPKTTASALHNAWLTMLKQARKDPCPKCSGEGTTEIFSAQGDNGKTLEAVRIYPGTKTLELTKLAGLLIEYCRGPVAQRGKLVREIQIRATELQGDRSH